MAALRAWLAKSGCSAVVAVLVASSDCALAQTPSTLRVTVRDETQAALIHAVVTLIAPTGAQGQVLVDESGNATFGGLVPGIYQVRVEAEGFQGYTVPFTVKRGANTAIATLTVAIREEVLVKEQSAAERRDNGFTTVLTADDIAGLSDDPDEMADQLMQMAGPGAQIFIDGFRGGRLPPKDQIQQIRFQTNSFAAEYHEAGMVRIEVITKPGVGNWRGNFNFGFRDESLNATNAFATERSPEQQKRFMFNFQGPHREGQDQPRDHGGRQHVVRRADHRRADADGRNQRSDPAPGRRRQRERADRAGHRPDQQPARGVCAPQQLAPQPGRRRLRSPRARLRERDHQRHAARAQHADHRQEAVQRTPCRAVAIRADADLVVERADGPRARCVHLRRRRAVGRARRAAVHRGAELRLHDRQAHAARRRRSSRAAGGTARPRPTPTARSRSRACTTSKRARRARFSVASATPT